MISPEEEFLSLSDAAAYVARKYGGRRPHVNTVARWCIYGLRGTKLESLKRGGHRVTTKDALHSFFAEAAYGSTERTKRPDGPKPTLSPTAAARHEAATRELIAEGL